MLRRERRYLAGYLKWLENGNVPFTVDVSHKSYTVNCDMGKMYFSDNFLTIDGLNLVRSVRKYVKDNDIVNKFEKKTPKQLRIQYICFDKRYIGKNMTAPIEVDKDKAYWNAARKLGIISKEIFDKGIEITQNRDGIDERKAKISRLVALGTLAKEVKRREFNGDSYLRPKTIEDSAETKHLWHHICSEVDTVMRQCMKRLRGNFVFYWTDAIFIMPDRDNEAMVKRVIEEYGYTSKTIHNAWYEFRPDACYIISKEKGRYIDDNQVKDIDLEWAKKNVDLKTLLELPQDKFLPIDKKLKKIIQKKLKMRNFCYAITNEDIWKTKPKKKNKAKLNEEAI